MKKILTYIIITLSSLSMASLTYAQTVTTDDIFKPFPTENVDITDRAAENIQYVTNLPNAEPLTIIGEVIQKMLAAATAIAAIAVTVAALFFMFSLGKEDEITKAKKMLTFAIIGLVIIGGSYAIVTAVVKLRIFDYFNK